jgi:hypothetical protein
VIIYNVEPALLHQPLSWGLVEINLFVMVGLPVVELTYRCIERPGLRMGARLAARFHRRDDARPPVQVMTGEAARAA